MNESCSHIEMQWVFSSILEQSGNEALFAMLAIFSAVILLAHDGRLTDIQTGRSNHVGPAGCFLQRKYTLASSLSFL